MTATAAAADAPPQQDAWADANQQHLVAAIAEVRVALERHHDGQPAARAANGRPGPLSPPAALDRVTEAFALSGFERAVLVLCAGVELDAAVASLCGSGPTFGLALAALEGAHWSAVTPDAPLRRWRLVELPGSGPLTNATLRVDEHVLHLLAGVPGTDPKLSGVVTTVSSVGDTTPGQVPSAHTLGDLWRTPDSPVAILTGADRESRIAVAGHAARDLGMSLALLDARVLPTDPGTREELARLLERESVLSGRAYLLECEVDTVAAVDALLSLTAAPLVVSAADPPALRRSSTLIVDVPRPTAHEQRELWRSLAGDEAPVDALVAAFDLELLDHPHRHRGSGARPRRALDRLPGDRPAGPERACPAHRVGGDLGRPGRRATSASGARAPRRARPPPGHGVRRVGHGGWAGRPGSGAPRCSAARAVPARRSRPR